MHGENELENKVYSYMFAKQVMPCTTTESTFTDFNAISGDKISSSTIYYIELVDEHPDSSETMRYVSG